MTRNEILQRLGEMKKRYEKEGFELLGIFGSVAEGTADRFSDLDIAYRIDYDRFSKTYRDGFSKILRIDEIRKELEEEFHRKVDLVSGKSETVIEKMIHV
jgi:predicted nucleotidyltransferase